MCVYQHAPYVRSLCECVCVFLFNMAASSNGAMRSRALKVCEVPLLKVASSSGRLLTGSGTDIGEHRSPQGLLGNPVWI